MGENAPLRRLIICGLLAIPFLWMLGCEGATTAEPTAEAPPAAVPPPAYLQDVEVWQPYLPATKAPVGDAALKPVFLPMRSAVANLDRNPELKQSLVAKGLKINTARTVVLTETAIASLPQEPPLAADTGLATIEAGKEYSCVFRQACDPFTYDAWLVSQTVVLEGTSGVGEVSSYQTPAGEPGTVAQGLYGYEYHTVWRFVGDPAAHCVRSFSVDFGPVSPLDYDGDGVPDFGASILWSLENAPPTVKQEGTNVTVYYDPPVCAGKAEGEGEYGIQLVLASPYAAHTIEGQVHDINGVAYPVQVLAPDHAPGEVSPLLVELEGEKSSCIFDQDCKIEFTSTAGPFLLEGTFGTADVVAATTPPGELGTLGEGLYGSVYWIRMFELAGNAGIDCVRSFQIEFGPVTPLDYDQDGKLDIGFFAGSEGDVPPSIEQNGDTIAFRFDPPPCAGNDSVIFGMASRYPPHDVKAHIQDANGVTYTVKSIAPDYEQKPGAQETVSIAPVAAEDLQAFDPAKLEDMLQGEGVELGLLVLETNAANTLVPSGEYLERAWFDGDEGVVELVDVESGDTVTKLLSLASYVPDPGSMTPTASIYLGTKWCLTHMFDWCICRPCFFWEPTMTITDCKALLPTCGVP